VKKLLLILLPFLILVSLGVVFGLNYVGILKIPFLPHMKKVVKKTGKQPVAKAPVKPAPPKPTPVVTEAPKPKPKVVVPPPDVEAGAKKLAGLWNSMEAPQLLAIVANWKESELAHVLVKMDSDKVSELLGAMDPAKASSLSHAIQVEAAKPKTPALPPAS
jgi:hypothetical protein